MLTRGDKMALSNFLRRYNVTTSKFEYLFLQTTDISVTWNDNSITPALPYNSSASIAGSNTVINPSLPDNLVSPNIQLDLGIAQAVLKVSGTLTGVAGTRIPQFSSASEVYIIQANTPASQPTTITPLTGANTVSNPTTTATSPPALSGVKFRNLLFSFAADQANGNSTNYTAHAFGQYNWGGPDDVLPATWTDNDGSSPVAFTGSYRIWNGVVKNLTIPEEAGQIDNFEFSFDFVVGAQL